MAMNTPRQADSEPRLSQAAGLPAARVGHAQSQVQAAGQAGPAAPLNLLPRAKGSVLVQGMGCCMPPPT